MSVVSGVAQDARTLIARADALRAQCEMQTGSASDDAMRTTLSRVAGRLGSSVVRPLAAALGADHATVSSEPAGGELQLAHELHLLAVDATRLRVRAPGALALHEAAAALQDLACQAVADDTERLEARLTEFAGLLAGLPATIQSAPGGPYLLTNVETLTNWLGVSLDPTPLTALCRCGASATKPWCDGSHAQIGFEDAKSEDRVPDRLDHYRGLGIAIADNRATCAHSGFCTDRLPTVFRTDEEPFVAPAGGRVDEILRAALARSR